MLVYTQLADMTIIIMSLTKTIYSCRNIVIILTAKRLALTRSGVAHALLTVALNWPWGCPQNMLSCRYTG
jgi:hypothetical protein